MSIESDWIWSPDHGDFYKAIPNPDAPPLDYSYIWWNSFLDERQPINLADHAFRTSYTTTASQPNPYQHPDSQSSYTTTISQPSGRYSPSEILSTTTTYQSSSPHWAKASQTRVRRFIIEDMGRFEYVVPGKINGNILVKAFPDTCSTFNIVSKSFLEANGISFSRSEQTEITLPNRTAITTIGNLHLSFQFRNNVVLNLYFAVLAACVHDVMIGNTFLQRCNLSEAHQSWKDVVERQRKQAVTHRPQVCLANSPQQAVAGYINDCEAVAAPDTGSEVNLIRLDYAIELGLDIDYNDITELEQIDGSGMMTCGIIREAVWRFGTEGAGHCQAQSRISLTPVKKRAEMREFGRSASLEEEYVCNFLVVHDLAVKLILSADLLYGVDAFSACSTSFSNTFGNPSSAMLIRKKVGWKEKLQNFLGVSRTAPPVNHAGTTLTEGQREARLREYTESWIGKMQPGPQQQAAWDQEMQRQRAYNASHPYH